jgi:hypothetical protein
VLVLFPYKQGSVISGYRSAASSPSGVPSSNPLIQHGTL